LFSTSQNQPDAAPPGGDHEEGEEEEQSEAKSISLVVDTVTNIVTIAGI
jgi:hypothetical protein